MTPDTEQNPTVPKGAFCCIGHKLKITETEV